MNPTFDNGLVRLFAGDVLEVLRELPAESVQTCVTSPPYWGLRDYGLPPAVWGGDEGCEHAWGEEKIVSYSGEGRRAAPNYQGGNDPERKPTNSDASQGTFCACGAWRGCLGLEPTIDLYVEHMVEVFREVGRVLRADGTVWLNLGDSYASSGGERSYGSSDNGTGRGPGTRRLDVPSSGLKPKDLCGIPWRVAFALQADGWWLRSDIVWSKPNPMPESVTDRPTRSHEYVFLLSKSARYYYDAEAIREPQIDFARGASGARVGWDSDKRVEPGNRVGTGAQKDRDGNKRAYNPGGRNKRTVWDIPTEAYPDAHFATFPQKLVEPCILAGTPAKGSCSECGAPWERVVEVEDPEGRLGKGYHDHTNDLGRGQRGVFPADGAPTKRTTGWRGTCDHDAESEPAMVLDPFVGSGTTAFVAQRLGRRAIGIDLGADYLALAEKRLCGQTLPMALP